MQDGILLVNKPAEWTSHDVVAKLRGILRTRRIGHGGTLDPMATGVLVVFVGKATKQVQFHESANKTYVAGLKLGVRTNTYDVTGEVTYVSPEPVSVSAEQLETALERFRGEQQQFPPMFSAVKIKGKKLYEYARKGQEIERKPRGITVNKLEILGGADADWTLNIDCSKGTYIRSLCNDIGDEVGTGGTMSSLIRTRSGDFYLEQCHTLEEINDVTQDGYCPWIF
ncbi:MAG: tRNA pseudouridine(55) synthase TruB [Oscillospiraceae bacterium]|jgi:tRNA pseudouridine55 synthase|nr:tRNA pseudouridine(55) synthase TruB [Oscillospiraceae bacterium]